MEGANNLSTPMSTYMPIAIGRRRATVVGKTLAPPLTMKNEQRAAAADPQDPSRHRRRPKNNGMEHWFQHGNGQPTTFHAKNTVQHCNYVS